VLAGHRGHCDDYQRASGLGHTRQPFTWLPTSSLKEDNDRLAGELQELKRTRETVWFEAWELKDERWQRLLRGKVRVLYAEVDAKISKVRVLLQWAPAAQPRQPLSDYQEYLSLGKVTLKAQE